MTIEQVAVQIQKHQNAGKPVLIAIEGFGGSGKTTLAQKLKHELGDAYVVNIDDFIIKDKLTEDSWDKGAFDRRRLEEQVLLPAKKQQPIQYEELIWETNELSEPKKVPTITYLIVEGISSYHPDIARYYNHKIWIDTTIKVAKTRGYARDKANENADKWDMWAENDLKYQQKYQPERVADFIVENV